jgi:methyl-accepting chemotaxis protein
MTGELSQQPAVASRVERLVERAVAFAVDEHDDGIAVARLAWLAQDDHAALEAAGEVCLRRTGVDLAVRGRATGLLTRARHRKLRDQAVVGYGERSAIQEGIGGRADLEGATAKMSTEVGDLDAALAALYRLPLEQFVATRDQLARRLRAAGDRATARRVAGLRRPPVSAWAVNQLAHAAPNAVAELLEVGAALRQAQQDALAGQPGAARQLRTATAHLRAAITRLSQRAETLLARAGHAASDATLARLAATLQAAATGDEATRAALAQGRLPGDLDPAGFGLEVAPAPAEPTAPARVAAAAPAAPVDRADARRERARAARRALEQARQAAEHAQAVLGQAETLAASRQQAADQAHQRAEQLTAVAQDLAEQAAAAATAAEEARQAADAADRDADEVADRARVARQSAEAAEAAHAAAAATLEGLEDQPR